MEIQASAADRTRPGETQTRLVNFGGDAKLDLAFENEGRDNVTILINTCREVTTFTDLRDFIGRLPPAAFRTGGQRDALLSVLADTEAANASGDTDEAVHKLQNLRRRVDGCPPAADMNDWIIDCTAQVAFRTLLDELIAGLSS